VREVLVRSEVVRLVEVAEILESILKRTWTLQDLYDHVGLSAKLQAVLAGQSGDYAAPRNRTADPYSLSGTTRKVLIPSITSSTSLTTIVKFTRVAVWFSTQLQSNTLKSNRAECRA